MPTQKKVFFPTILIACLFIVTQGLCATQDFKGTINGNTITASTGTLTFAAGKVLTVNNTLTLSGTDGSTLNIGTGGTLGTAAFTAATAYQPTDATLTSIALLGTAADKMLYTTGIDTWAESSITAAGRAILDDATAAAQATTLGLGTLDSPVFSTVKLSGLTDDYIPYHVSDAAGFANGPTKTNVDSAVSLKHAQSHSIISTGDHTSAATSGQMLKADANGLPINATNTDAQVSSTVTASHAAVTVIGPISLSGQLVGLNNDAAAAITEVDTGALANIDTVVPTSKAVTSAISTHAALITGVHGLVFTAGKTLTLTESLTLNALPVGGLAVATAANTLGSLAVGATTQVLVGGGAGVVPVWSADLPTAVTIGSAYIYRAAGTDVPVTDGGTGVSTLTTAYGLLAAGTTATGNIQTLPAGATTGILVGGGAAALPIWTAATGTGAPVRADSPSLTSPTLGTPASGTLTNATGLPAAGVVGTASVIANTIKGDGTAGRVFRSVYFLISNGTDASTVKVQRINRWNGDAEAAQDNIAKGATTGNYSLNAAGNTLTWLNSGITGDAVAVFAGELYANEVTVAHTVNVDKNASGITLVFYTAAGGTVVDITSIIDTGAGGLSVNIVYITSE